MDKPKMAVVISIGKGGMHEGMHGGMAEGEEKPPRVLVCSPDECDADAGEKVKWEVSGVVKRVKPNGDRVVEIHEIEPAEGEYGEKEEPEEPEQESEVPQEEITDAVKRKLNKY